MIAFDLECSQGHPFEGWFDSHEAFQEQQEKKLICCPYCEDSSVRRVMSPVAVKKSSPDSALGSGGIDYRRLAKEVVRYVQENFEDVGTKFASEALKMHYDAAEKRNIRGVSTPEEEKMLKEEGVEFFKLPMPKKPEEKQN